MATKFCREILEAILLANGVSVFLFGLRVIATGSTQYWFLFWNLILGWVPALVAGMLSLVWVHRAMIARGGNQIASMLIGVSLLATSFGIYLGRSLRWNT